MLDTQRISMEFHTISASEGSFGILDVIELDKSVAALGHNVDHFSIGGEKVPQVRIGHIVGQSANVKLEGCRCGTSAPLTLVLGCIRPASLIAILLFVVILFVAAHGVSRVTTAPSLFFVTVSLLIVVVG